MDRKKLFKHLAYLIFFIFLVNFSANKFYWYYSIWYFDIVMHFLGGVWVGLACIYFFALDTISFRLIFKILLFVLLIGVSWEIFEFFVNKINVQNPFNVLDTLSDIFLDLAGGLLGVFYFLFYPLKNFKSIQEDLL
ncbi:MAG: hypothetical protein AAB809_01255 [Patescibacteria group bacterium]